MGWNSLGYIRQGVNSFTPVLAVERGDGSQRPIGLGNYGTYEVHNGLCTAHWSINLDSTMMMVIPLYTGEFIMPLPVNPVNYGTFLMAGSWWIERFWGGGGFGNLEITRQFNGGAPYVKMLINRYHDDPIAILRCQDAKDYYLWSDSSIKCSIQYPVET